MECSELTERVVLGLSGEAGEDSRQDLERHLLTCAACRAEASRVEQTWAVLGEDPDAPVTGDFRGRTVALIEDEMMRRRIKEFRPRVRWPRLAAQAAALAVACAAGFFLARRGPAALQSAGAGSSTAPSSDTILRDVRVLAIDQTSQTQVSKDTQLWAIGKTATLELTPPQSEMVGQAIKEGTLSLALRALGDNKQLPAYALGSGGVEENGIRVFRAGVLRKTEAGAEGSPN